MFEITEIAAGAYVNGTPLSRSKERGWGVHDTIAIHLKGGNEEGKNNSISVTSKWGRPPFSGPFGAAKIALPGGRSVTLDETIPRRKMV